MFGCLALIATLIIAGEPRHQLLRARVIAAVDLIKEVGSFCAAQGGGQAAVMMDFHVAGLACRKCKAEIVRHSGLP